MPQTSTRPLGASGYRTTLKACAILVQIWVSEVQLSAEGLPDITISSHAWVNTLNSPRAFFKGTGCLPSQTPAGLKKLRRGELDIIKARACS